MKNKVAEAMLLWMLLLFLEIEKLQQIHNLKKEKGGLVLNRFSKYQGRLGGCGGMVWGGRRCRQGRGSDVVVDVVVVFLWKWKIAENPQLEEIRRGDLC